MYGPQKRKEPRYGGPFHPSCPPGTLEKGLADEAFGAHCRSAAEVIALPIDHINSANRAISALQIKPISAITAADDALHI